MANYRLPRTPALLAVLAAATVTISACSGADHDASAEVASLVSTDDATGDAASAADAAVRTDETVEDLAPDEAALEFSQCMRAEGLDFPDLSVDAEGNIALRDAFQSIDRQADGFREAMDTCGEILQQTGFGGGRREAMESAEVQDAFLQFSQCVRDAGYDVGDLTLGGPGPGTDPGPGEGTGAPPDEGEGQAGERQPGFGDRSERFADQLGLDPEDPAVAETIEGCMAIIDEAFATAGVGQPPAGG